MKDVMRTGSTIISPIRYKIKMTSTRSLEGTTSRTRREKQTLVSCMPVKKKRKEKKKIVQKEGVVKCQIRGN